MGAQVSAAGAPRVRTGIVERGRLSERLQRGSGCLLTLVCAPAGYGKTVAVASWLAARGHAAAWVSLDARDNDPVRLWSSVADATAAALDGVGADVPGLLPSSPVAGAIDALAAALRRDGRTVALVLDDVHVLDDERCLRTLDHAIGVLPANAQLVLVARTAPPLRLARLRAQGQLVEIGVRELALTTTEAGRVMRAVDGLGVDDATVRALHARTEGWPAALYLGALYLRESPDTGSALAALDGARGHVADLLAHEVVAELDPEMRRFLERTAALHALHGELCDEVLDMRGSSELLRELVRTNLLVTELADRRGWYRCHALLREHLLGEADPAQVAATRHRALRWSRRHGLPEDAAEYAVVSADFAALAQLIADDGVALARAGRAATLARWTDALPPDVLAARPDVLAAAVASAHSVGRPALEIRRRLAVAHAAWTADPARWSAYEACLLHATLAYYATEDAARILELARTAVGLAREDGEDLLVYALSALANAQLLAGDPGAADSAAEAIAHPDAAGRPYGYLNACAIAAVAEVRAGRPTIAREHADRALGVGRNGSLAGSPSMAWAEVADAVVAVAEGRPAQAERAALRATRRVIPGGLLEAWMRLELAAIQVRRGRAAAASRSLGRARELLDRAGDRGALSLRAGEVAAALRPGAPAAAAIETPSPAEMAVLRLLGDHTAREIGDELYLSVNTVKTHIRSIYRKLGARSREDAVRRAASLGLLDDAPRAQSASA